MACRASFEQMAPQDLMPDTLHHPADRNGVPQGYLGSVGTTAFGKGCRTTEGAM